jgi:hypothetical protein
MGPWTPRTTEAACGVNTGAASNFGSSRYVRLDGQKEAIIKKNPSDQIFAANAAVMGVGVTINSN